MRKTKNEMAKLQANGFYREVDLGDPQAFHTDIEKKKAEDGGFTVTDDDRYAVYEVHADLVIDDIDAEDGDIQIAKPYIVTIERGTSEILAVRRNWDPEDPLMLKRQHFVHYVYVPGFGFYGLGLIHIIGGYARAGTSLIRQLVDAGTLSNLPGGLKSRGLRIKGDDTPINPGEWKDVDVPSGSIRDNIMPLPYKEPSQTLLALLNQITTEGRRLGAISDMNISDMSANAPVGTTLALLERTLKPMAAVQARVHFAMKQEFKMLKAIMAEYAPAEYEYEPVKGEISARQADYMLVDVIPVSDPNSSTMAQRVVPTKDDAKPTDPISENMDALTGKPLQAFIYQDHDAHIAAHVSFMKDPQVAQMIGQNPQAQRIMASLQAHIAEHLGFTYRKQIEEKLGVPLPAPNKELPEEIEVELSRLIAKASAQLTQSKQQQAAQQQAQQQAQDPVFQIQQAELQIKQAEVQRKTAKDQMDAKFKQTELQQKALKNKADVAIDRAELAIQAKKEGVKLDLQKDQADKNIKMQLLNKITDSGGNNF